MEGKSDRKLREVCKKAKKHENAAQKSLKSVEHSYIYNFQVIINRHGRTDGDFVWVFWMKVVQD